MSSSAYPAATSYVGSDARTNVLYAIERLKEKFPAWISFDDLVSFVLPVHKRSDQEQVRWFQQFLQANPKVTYNRDDQMCRFRPPHDIASVDDLFTFLQNQDVMTGVGVRDLKEGWPNVETAVVNLEKEHKLLIMRNKKDNHPKTVWADDPTLQAPLDQEFKDLWNQIPLPPVEDTIRELRRMNYKSTGEPAVAQAAVRKEKAKKKQKRGTKVTNQHMQGLFRDYSGQRPKGAK